MNWEIYQSIGVSLMVGLLVGLQRQYSESDIAGIRTFPLITLLGTVCALLSDPIASWLVAAGLLSVAMLMFIANLAKIRAKEIDFGMTTEAAVLLMFVVGVLIGFGFTGPALVVAGITAVLLDWKHRLHNLVKKMTEKDMRGVIHLVLIGLVILPVLPNETYGPYDVLNPYSIWRMVVLIVGISLTAYVAYKLLGTRAGAILGGVLGGIISSTATTVSYARQSKGMPEVAAMSALVIMIASAIANVRVLFEIGVVAPSLLRVAAWPIGAVLLLMTVECGILMILLRKETVETLEHENPAQLKPAIFFGAMYAVVLFAVAASKDIFGDQALYGIAAISGMTDLDAITLSTAKLFNDDRVTGATAWRVILVATMSNLVFKGGAVALLGSRRLFFYIAALFGISILGAVAILLWWQN